MINLEKGSSPPFYTYLKRMYQLLHARFLARSAKDVLGARARLVHLEDDHQQWAGQVIVIQLVAQGFQRNAKFDSVFWGRQKVN